MRASAPSSAAPARAYARHEPETTVLHLVVREHLETFLFTVREERGKALPHYVEEELRRYLRCGILAYGFLRVVCPKCSGVFAPRSSWRADVVPKTTATRPVSSPSKKKTKREAASSLASDRAAASSGRGRASEYEAPHGPRTSLGDDVVRPVGARLDWASLLRRVYLEDVLACPCGGRRAIVADITERDVVVAILSHLQLPTEPPPIARARSPGSDAA